MIKISVIIPVYNVERSIEKCLNSIIAQECNEYQIECILVDDYSPDYSMVRALEIIEMYNGNGISFIIIHHKKNQGISSTRNSGIHASTGDYIIFVDSDDYLPNSSFTYLTRYANQHPDIEVIESNAFNKKMATQIHPYMPSVYILKDRNKIYSQFINFKFSVYVWNKMVKRSTIINNELFFEEGIIHEDILWSYKLFTSVSSVLYLPRVTYIYDYNPSSITNTLSNKVEEEIRSHLLICNKLFEMPPQTENIKNNYFVEYHIFIFTFLLRAIEMAYKNHINEELRQSLKSTKRRMLSECIKDYRFFLTLFVIIMYMPISLLLKMRLFRRLYFRIAIIIKRLSKITDIFHNNRYLQSSP